MGEEAISGDAAVGASLIALARIVSALAAYDPPMLRVAVPGGDDLALEHLLLDMNGTLTDRGGLIDGVAERMARVREVLAVHLLTADTFGTAGEVAAGLGVEWRRVEQGADKRRFLEALGHDRCVAVGNGANDVPMLRAAALGIALLGPEGTSADALGAADVVCRSVLEALDLLGDPAALTATLRP
jgi:soluble P-type ATPase